MTVTVKHKPGNDLQLLFVPKAGPTAYHNWDLHCHVYDGSGLKKLSELEVQKIPEGVLVKLAASASDHWPNGSSLRADLLCLSPSGVEINTDQFRIVTERRITNVRV